MCCATGAVVAHDPEVTEGTRSLRRVVREAAELAAELDLITGLLQERVRPVHDGEEPRRAPRP